MKSLSVITLLVAIWAGPVTLALGATSAKITVDAAQPGLAVSPYLYGIFLEDINLSADGGLYAELVRNRSFEDSERPEHWASSGDSSAEVRLTVDESRPMSSKNRRSLRVEVVRPGESGAGVMNGGYWGIPVAKGEIYTLSFLARGNSLFSGPLEVMLEGDQGQLYARGRVPRLHEEWKEYQLALRSKATDPHAKLVIKVANGVTFWLDMVSLSPKRIWKGRPNGLRPDLAEMLSALKPSFMRFPGGCWVEGETMKDAYRWKQTIGDLAERRTQYNLWQYHVTHGLGYHEYLQLAEDLGAEPLFVINCGMSHKEIVPMDQMQEYVQDALDALEYANGPVNSDWGGLRAKHGHPAPFNLKFIQIGNENGGPAYDERYALFHRAIRGRYPEVRLVANEWGGRPKKAPLDIVDEHYYNTPEFFLANADRYDSYDRAQYKVYVGEYAVTRNGGSGNLRAAVGEAAFMTGLERNSDVVIMASYAPLFANVHHKRWNPDLINFDNSRAYGTPGYYVQKMFSENRSETILPVEVNLPEFRPPVRSGGIGVGTWQTQAEFKDLKVTCGEHVLFAPDFLSGIDGWGLREGRWSAREGVLSQKDLKENVRAFAGDKSWKLYTYSLKARKLGGREGFLIPFLVQNENVKAWWNIGGWGNTRHAIEMDGVMGNDASGSIETGRWYYIRIELHDTGVRCYLDDNLIHDVKFSQPKPLCAVAGRAKDKIILKVVNAASEPMQTTIALKGVSVRTKAEAIELTSEDPEDENSLEEPLKVKPVTRSVPCRQDRLDHVFPANSITVLSFSALK